MNKKGKITLANLVVNMIALFLVDNLVKGVYIGGFGTVLTAALLLMVLNRLVKPILELISLPMTIMTLGLFELLISAFILWIVDKMVAGMYFTSFSRYIIAVIIIAIVNGLFGRD